MLTYNAGSGQDMMRTGEAEASSLDVRAGGATITVVDGAGKAMGVVHTGDGPCVKRMLAGFPSRLMPLKRESGSPLEGQH